MTLLQGWLPPSREHWELLVWIWKLFPLFTLLQWAIDWYGMGKTSVKSRFNVPGKIGWATMEAPGFITLLYIMFTLPEQQGIRYLPSANWLMAGLFALHYLYRALLAPLVLNPSMSPIHILVWFMALTFQLINGSCIGGWLAGYGPTTTAEWEGHTLWIQLGVVVFLSGFIGNIIHDDELRAIRRRAAKRQAAQQGKDGKAGHKNVDKVYEVPTNGLFEYILFPHYFCEWVEWIGYWMIGGLNCVPARNFVINEVTSMLPRALSGRKWYIERFGEAKINGRKAVIPGIL